MNEFNEQKNDIPESRDKSQIDDDVKLIRDELLNEDNNYKNNEINNNNEDQIEKVENNNEENNLNNNTENYNNDFINLNENKTKPEDQVFK